MSSCEIHSGVVAVASCEDGHRCFDLSIGRSDPSRSGKNHQAAVGQRDAYHLSLQMEARKGPQSR